MGSMTLTGDARVNRQLSKLAGKDGKKVVRKAQRPALKPMLQQVRQTTPRGQTGTLRKATKLLAIRTRKGVAHHVTTNSKAFPDIFYGGFVHYGTRKMKANEWIKKAADAKQSTVLRIYGTELRSNLLKLAKGTL